MCIRADELEEWAANADALSSTPLAAPTLALSLDLKSSFSPLQCTQTGRSKVAVSVIAAADVVVFPPRVAAVILAVVIVVVVAAQDVGEVVVGLVAGKQ